MNVNYLYGCILGDGCITRVRVNKDGTEYLQMRIVVKEGRMLDSIEEILESLGCSYSYRRKKGGKEPYGDIAMSSNQELCREWSLKLGRLDNKKLPEVNSFEDLMALTSGLMDTDGCCKRRSVDFLNTNESLVDSLSRELSKYGIKTSKTFVPRRKPNYKDQYNLHFSYETLNLTEFDLKIDRKRDRYLENKVISDYVSVDRDWVVLNEEYIRKILGRSTYHHLLKGRNKRIHRSSYIQIEDLRTL